MLNKNIVMLVLALTIASCSANKKSSDSQTAAPLAKPKEVLVEKKAEDDSVALMFSVSAAEIEKSGTKPVVVYFDTNSSKLSDQAASTLNEKVVLEAKNKNTKKVVIEAHCDERGSKVYNKKLSLKRANTVKNHLVKNGVKGAIIKTVGYGEDKPAATGHDEASWAKNRRAVTIVIKR